MVEEKRIKVAIHGYYGYRNAGDEAILAVIIQELRREIPYAEPVVLSADPEWTEAIHGIRAVNCHDLTEVAACIREAALVISGGGGLFQEYWLRDNAEILTFPTAGIAYYSQVPLLAKLYGKPLAVVAHGVGPVETQEVAHLVRFTFGLADRVTVRDEGSLALLQDLGCAERVVAVAPDPAFAIPIPSRKKARRHLEQLLGVQPAESPRLIGVCLRSWQEENHDWPLMVAQALDIFLAETDAIAVFVPFQKSETTNDVTQSRHVVSLMDHGDRCRILDVQPPTEVVALLAGCDAVLGMRLHATIFAIAAGVPVLALAYDPKVTEAMRMAGQEERVVKMGALDPSGLAAHLKDLLDEGPAMSRARRKTAVKLKERVGAHFQGLADLIEKAIEPDQDHAAQEGAPTVSDRFDAPLPLVDLKDRTLRYLEAQLEEGKRAMQEARIQAETERQFATQQLAEKEDRLATVQAQVAEREDANADLQAQVEERDEAVAEVNSRLDDITSSTGWTLLQVLWRIRLILAPRGSNREHIGRFGMRGLRYWSREGKLSFPLKIAGWISRRIWIQLSALTAPVRRRIEKAVKPLVPQAARKIYRELRREYPFVDRTEVVLYADPSILSTYTPRQPLNTLSCEAALAQLKVSLIVPVRDEEASAREWLNSLLSQSRYPDEVVIVDGGSTDRTVEIIEEFARSAPMDVRLIEAPGVTVAQGRNIAIENATYPIIACTDFGCTLDKDWLRLLVTPFAADTSIEVSVGYSPPGNLDPYRASFFVPDLDAVNPQTFLPPGRCVAMKKTLWVKIGGYAEWLTYAGEDTLFDFQAKSQPSRWAFVPQAKVLWEAPQTLLQTFRTVFRYAKGDGEAALFAASYRQRIRHALQFVTLLGVGLLFAVLALVLSPWALLLSLLLLGTTGIVLGRSFLSFRSSRRGPRQLASHFLVSAIIVVAQILGFSAGVANRPQVKRRQIELYGRRLIEIITDHPQMRGIIIYPPTHDWGFMFQRPHQMARALARKGYLYFFCTNNDRTDAVVGFNEVEPYLFLCHVPLETFGTIKNPTVYIGGAPWHRSVLPLFDRPRIVYDHYDDLQVSTGRREDHEGLLEAAAVVVVTSQRLLEAARRHRRDALLVPNAVDYKFIQESRPPPGEAVPADWKPIMARGKPIIGYSGALAEWFDYSLLCYAAKARPDLEFVLIGVNYDGSVDRSGMLDLPNVHWLGMKDYDELFKYVWRFDIAIIPFRINDITLATSPIKLFEYLACQKPVVSTALPECNRYEEVFVAKTYDEFVHNLDQALAARARSRYISRIRRIAEENTWDSRAEMIDRALSNVLGEDSPITDIATKLEGTSASP